MSGGLSGAVARLTGRSVVEGGVQQSRLATGQGGIPCRGVIKRKQVGGEDLQRQLVEQAASGGPAPIASPAPGEPCGNRAHLGAADGQAPPVELTAQRQRD